MKYHSPRGFVIDSYQPSVDLLNARSHLGTMFTNYLDLHDTKVLLSVGLSHLSEKTISWEILPLTF